MDVSESMVFALSEWAQSNTSAISWRE